MPAELIVSGIAATLQALQTWYQVKDRKRAAEQFQKRDEVVRTPELVAAAKKLSTIVPQQVLDTIQARLEKCWSEYTKVLQHPEEYGPAETEDATKAVIRCVCREVARVRQLNGGVVPDGPMQEFDDRYQCA